MSGEAFEEFAEAYEAMIDWPKRLANEGGLFRWIFERVGAGKVLDAACGTGHHAAMFHSWGLSVEGADLSAAMIARCRNRWGQDERLSWIVRGFDQAVKERGQFDAAVCIGNSLALGPDRGTIEMAVRRLVEAVRPGGAVVVHVLNLWRLEDGPCVWQKCLRAKVAERESLIIKGVHRCGERGYVELLVTPLGEDRPAMRAESAMFWGLEAEELDRWMRQAGAGQVEVFGNYQRQAYDRAGSTDLIVVGIR